MLFGLMLLFQSRYSAHIPFQSAAAFGHLEILPFRTIWSVLANNDEDVPLYS